MKAIVFKIASLFMALLVLFSTLSFSVGMHFCGDSLVDFALFESVDTCGMEAVPSKASTSCDTMEMDMDCCSDVAFVVEGQQELKLSFDTLTFEQQVFVTSFFYTYPGLYRGPSTHSPFFKDYAPPPLIRDVQILDQTFLI